MDLLLSSLLFTSLLFFIHPLNVCVHSHSSSYEMCTRLHQENSCTLYSFLRCESHSCTLLLPHIPELFFYANLMSYLSSNISDRHQVISP
jgi:hypothetical protein